MAAPGAEVCGSLGSADDGGATVPGMSSASLSQDPLSPQEALDRLKAGNQRWVSGWVEHPGQSIERRESLVGSQSPFAVIVSCVDSRVPPELIFDCGLGDLLCVRSAGHTLDDIGVGSVEFGPCELRSPLILVLGHRRCGAVTAAVAAFQNDHWPPGHVRDVVEALRPAYEAAVDQLGEGDLIDKVVTANSILAVARLKREGVFADLLEADRLRILGGRYDLDTGGVTIFG